MATSASGISFGGLFSGLDTESIIAKLMQIERLPINRLENKKTQLGFEKDALNETNNSLLSLKNSLTYFASLTGTNLLQNTVTSSDETVVTASTDGSAISGTYSIDTTGGLGTAHRVRSDYQTTTNTFGAALDTFRITVAGTNIDVSLTGASTLSQIADLINSDSQNTSLVRASVVTNPSNSSESTLIIESVNAGTANAITFDDTTGTVLQTIQVIVDAGNAIKNTVNAAADAAIKINGITYTSTNSASTAIDGVTLTFNKTGTASVVVGVNDDAIVEKVKTFVNQFNATTDLLAAKVKEDKVRAPKTTSDLQKGVLSGDYDLSYAKSQIRSLLMATNDKLDSTGTNIPEPYFSNFSTSYDIAQEIGIDSEASSGSYVSDNITLDESKLRTALSTNRNAVASYLYEMTERLDAFLEDQTKVSASQQYSGTFYARVLGVDYRVEQIDDDIENWETKVAAEEERLRAQFTAMEQILQSLQTQGSYLSSQLSSITGAAKK